MIKWTSDRNTMQIESEIAKRAVIMAGKYGLEYKQMDAVMDIDACHNNGCPLNLAELLKADDANFMHDVFGIRANIDHKTGKPQNCFYPRYAIRKNR